METFSCITIDDNPLALAVLTKCIGKMDCLSLVKAYSDPALALKEINELQTPIDFLFLDVEMPVLNGLSLATQIGHKATNIVLVSAHLLYSLEGYNINAKHFLYKPFDFEKFETTVKSIMHNMAKEKPYLMVKLSSTQIQRIYIDDIIAVEGNGNYIKIHTIHGVLAPYYKLVAMEHDLKAFLFMKRINKSYIISTKHIEKIDGFSISLKHNLNLSVGESYRSDFKKSMAKLLDLGA